MENKYIGINFNKRKMLIATVGFVLGSFTYVNIAGFKHEESQWFINFIKKYPKSEIETKKELSKEKGIRNESDILSTTEIDDIIWNIYNESKISNISQIGIILSVIDRMLHPNFPKTATGVIFEHKQYSWVYKKRFPLEGDFYNEKDTAIPRWHKKRFLINIRNLIYDIFQNRTIKEVREILIKIVNKNEEKIPVERKVLFYRSVALDKKWNQQMINEQSESSEIFFQNLITKHNAKKVVIESLVFYLL